MPICVAIQGYVSDMGVCACGVCSYMCVCVLGSAMYHNNTKCTPNHTRPQLLQESTHLNLSSSR